MKKKLFIFDLDGTLLDTTPIGFRKIERNLIRLGLPSVSTDFLRTHWGKPAKELFKIVCDEVGASMEQFEDFCRYDKTMMEEYFMDPCLMRSLRYLKNKGAILGILTSRTTESVARLSAKVSFDLQLFEFIQTGDTHEFQKPDGRVFNPLLEWAHSKKIESEEIIYFGDTINYDLAATRAAKEKIDFVAVVSGVNTHQEFIEARIKKSEIMTGCRDLPPYIYQCACELIEANKVLI